MWTIVEIMAVLTFIFLFVVGLVSVARDLLQRPLYPSPIGDSREEDMRAIDAVIAAKNQLAIAELEEVRPPTYSDAQTLARSASE
jgi:hypothetical protein